MGEASREGGASLSLQWRCHFLSCVASQRVRRLTCTSYAQHRKCFLSIINQRITLSPRDFVLIKNMSPFHWISDRDIRSKFNNLQPGSGRLELCYITRQVYMHRKRINLKRNITFKAKKRIKLRTNFYSTRCVVTSIVVTGLFLTKTDNNWYFTNDIWNGIVIKTGRKIKLI